MAESVAVVGAGIVGLAHAWREAAHGAKVTLFERSPRAEGASVRNFGMVWPVGQPPATHNAALLSRGLWDEFTRETGVWNSPIGSLHVVTREDELAVLEEFVSTAKGLGYDCELLNAGETRRRSPGSGANVLGSLFSPTEMGVDPREAIAKAPLFLEDRYDVRLRFDTTIVDIDLPLVRSSEGECWEFDRVTVASGADFATLYPEVFARNSLHKCKLQMMRTTPQLGGWRMGPMIAGGLTLRHYATFGHCETLSALKHRIAEETPELDRYGIHVMAAQNGLGEVVLGDSHEYGVAITPFDNDEITRLMLRELHKFMDLPSWDLQARWHGVYAVQEPRGLQFEHQPAEGVRIVIATGGCGMTMSFGLAEQIVTGNRAFSLGANA